MLLKSPGYWDAQVRPLFPDIDVTFAGHTHGAQFGVETGDVKWSPSQYGYKQWAGHYKQDNQQLYVNRGFGFMGIPTRLGILPEITLFELNRSS